MKFGLTVVVFAQLAFAHVTRTFAPLIINDNAEIIPDEYVVVLKNDVALTKDFLSECAINESQIIHRLNLGFAARLNDENVAALRRKVDVVDFIEPNQVVHTMEQQKMSTWNLARISQEKFTARTTYNYPASAGEGVTVYVVDTGVNTDHQDFEGRATWGITVPKGESDTDGLGHGTHVASTVAGVKYGVAKKAKIVAVKVLKSNGYGTTADVIAGVEWSSQQAKGTKSIGNMSLGGGRSRALDTSVRNAILGGLQFAVAAGNSNADACNSSPSGVKEAVCVGSMDRFDRRSYFSNIGDCVDIFGPGSNVLAAWIGSKTAVKTISGTSMASPHLAGVMALMLSENDYTPQELFDTVLDMGTGDILTGIPSGTPNLLVNIQQLL